MCVSSKHGLSSLFFFFLLFMYVDLCVGGATVSLDSRGYNEKGSGRSGESQGEGDDVRCIVGGGEGERGRQPDREVVSVYQEHTALAGSSLSVVVPSSSLLQHLPARHQAEQDPVPSTAHLKTGAPSIAFSSRPSCLLLLIPAHNSLSSHQTV